ncbi:hypothetical protein JKP88DRAFT_300240 [Tribonema minus]|uniref:GST N-terminal domain-containing protein n=1 Tax=Tribonema minus TaxID=303371 RepID=A0A835ZEM8_9STRA|nr:hypothetical protein JKP88DRAFT_300240 [Tribonema minus]
MRLSITTMAATSDLPPLTVPERFKAPPKPHGLGAGVAQAPSVAAGAAATAIRGTTSIGTIGWQPSLSTDDEGKEGGYELEMGPVSVKDTDETLRSLPRPKKPIILYEYEASPYCRKVREACAMLDLVISVRPCPRFGDFYREELESVGGQQQFPYMVDENTGTSMYESDSITDYLFNTYGPGADAAPAALKGNLGYATSGLASAARGLRGGLKRPNSLPENPQRREMELWGYEGSPFVKPVREALTELQLPHKIVYCARGSLHREEMVKNLGNFQVPYLKDPNTGVEMFESRDIVEYLESVYTKPSLL